MKKDCLLWPEVERRAAIAKYGLFDIEVLPPVRPMDLAEVSAFVIEVYTRRAREDANATQEDTHYLKDDAGARDFKYDSSTLKGTINLLDEGQEPTLYDLIKNNTNFSTLLHAIDAAHFQPLFEGLGTPINLTLFAPDDAA